MVVTKNGHWSLFSVKGHKQISTLCFLWAQFRTSIRNLPTLNPQQLLVCRWRWRHSSASPVGNRVSIVFLFVVSFCINTTTLIKQRRRVNWCFTCCIFPQRKQRQKTCVYCLQFGGSSSSLCRSEADKNPDWRIMVITGCHWLTAGSHHYRVGGRAADAYHCVAVGDSSQSHDGRHLDSHCSWTKNSSALLSPNEDEMTTRWCMLIVLKARTIPSVDWNLTVSESKGLWPADIICNHQ